MALKDWRKTRNDEIAQVWLHKKKKIGVVVQMAEFSKDYLVHFGSQDNANTKEFRTKAQALKFARDYRRTH